MMLNSKEKTSSQNKKLFLEIHALETLPPSCVNSDQYGSPKTAVFGGQLRYRVSSQAWKRAARLDYEQRSPENRGIRTREVIKLFKKAMAEKNEDLSEEQLELNARQILEYLTSKNPKKLSIDDISGKKKSKKNAGQDEDSSEESGNDVMKFISELQVDELTDLVLAGEQDAKKYKKAFKQNPSVSMVLTGRMVAGNEEFKIDAASKVADAISTHPVEVEYDYFIATDDLNNNSGAGHLGTKEFSSATMYRYAEIDVEAVAIALLDRISPEEIAREITLYTDSFITSMPSGQKSNHGNSVRPEYILIRLREDGPESLANAFESGIQEAGGYMAPSIEAIEQHAIDLQTIYGNKGIQNVFVTKIGSSKLTDKTQSWLDVQNHLESVLKNYVSELKEVA